MTLRALWRRLFPPRPSRRYALVHCQCGGECYPYVNRSPDDLPWPDRPYWCCPWPDCKRSWRAEELPHPFPWHLFFDPLDVALGLVRGPRQR